MKFKIVVKKALPEGWAGVTDDTYEEDTDLEFISTLIYVLQEYPDHKVKITINGTKKEEN